MYMWDQFNGFLLIYYHFRSLCVRRFFCYEVHCSFFLGTKCTWFSRKNNQILFHELDICFNNHL